MIESQETPSPYSQRELRENAINFCTSRLQELFKAKKNEITENTPTCFQFFCPFSNAIAQKALCAVRHSLDDENYIIVDAYLRIGRFGILESCVTEKFVFCIRRVTEAESLTKRMITFYNKEFRDKYNFRIKNEYTNTNASHHRSYTDSPVSHTQFAKRSKSEPDIFSLDEEQIGYSDSDSSSDTITESSYRKRDRDENERESETRILIAR